MSIAKLVGLVSVFAIFLFNPLFFFEDLPIQEKTSEKPNIVLIYVDDMGYGDLGIYGAKGWETPNLDKLASEGIKFSDFHAATAVCSASRAALLTGSYPDRVGVRGAYFPNSKEGLNPAEKTLAEIVKEQGYNTAMVGKWHLGDAEEMMPLAQGFDSYFGIPYSNDMWPIHYDGKRADSINSENAKWKMNIQELPVMEDNEKVMEIRDLDDQDKITTMYTERAVNFINKNSEKPFFLYVAHSMPHVPLGVSDKFKGKSEQGMYGDVMMEIDWSVGEIMKALEENGMEKNTLIIFTSDNGPWLNYGNHAGSTGGLREGKGSMWEGGTRVPALMKWPGKIEAGHETSELAINVDILPTISEIIGGKLPAHKIDGISMLPILNGEKSDRHEFWGYYGGNLIFIRKDDWKLYFPHTYRSYKDVEPGMDGFPGPYSKKTLNQPELYNLESDVNETENVIDDNPEIAKELLMRGDEVRAKLGDKITETTGSENREPGRIEK